MTYSDATNAMLGFTMIALAVTGLCLICVLWFFFRRPDKASPGRRDLPISKPTVAKQAGLSKASESLTAKSQSSYPRKANNNQRNLPKTKPIAADQVGPSKPSGSLAPTPQSTHLKAANARTVVRKSIEGTPRLKASKIGSPKFKPFNPDLLGISAIDDEMRKNNHHIAFYYVGTLDNGSKYSIMIGSSDEWVNIITLNWAQAPTYESYGFNIIEQRWSYGSRVKGAPHFREFIANNIEEIIALMKTQSTIRKEKELARQVEEAELKREQTLREKQEKARLKQNAIIITNREPIIKQYFAGMTFDLNSNKRNHTRAQKQAIEHYYDIDIAAQTCNCKKFREINSGFNLYDVRRVCSHLYNAIWRNDLLKKKADSFEDFVLQNIKSNVWGIYFFAEDGGGRFAIIAYRDWIDLDVAMPKNNGEGYVMSSWRLEDGVWLARGGSKRLQQIVQTRLESLFRIDQ